MIILNLKKSNSNFEKNMNKYLNMTNFGHLTCPYCKSANIIRYGFYERNVIYFSGLGEELKSSVIKIQRVLCKSCGKTHALLPSGIIPYKQFTDEVISRVILELLEKTEEKVSEKYSIDLSIIKTWIYQLKKFHLSKIITFMKNTNILKTLYLFLNNDDYKLNYIIQNNICFMQIKLGILGISPS